jgi:uncharacterized protein (DUF2267 family)
MERADNHTTSKEAAKRLSGLVEKQHVLPEDVDPREAISAVLCVLTLRLGKRQAEGAFKALPRPLRSMVDFCILHRGERARVFALDEFLRQVADHLDVTPHTARRVIRTVLTALRADLPPEEIEQVAQQLPSDIRSLWLPDPG